MIGSQKNAATVSGPSRSISPRSFARNASRSRTTLEVTALGGACDAYRPYHSKSGTISVPNAETHLWFGTGYSAYWSDIGVGAPTYLIWGFPQGIQTDLVYGVATSSTGGLSKVHILRDLTLTQNLANATLDHPIPVLLMQADNAAEGLAEGDDDGWVRAERRIILRRHRQDGRGLAGQDGDVAVIGCDQDERVVSIFGKFERHTHCLIKGDLIENQSGNIIAVSGMIHPPAFNLKNKTVFFL
jgi:hypothetical protein